MRHLGARTVMLLTLLAVLGGPSASLQSLRLSPNIASCNLAGKACRALQEAASARSDTLTTASNSTAGLHQGRSALETQANQPQASDNQGPKVSTATRQATNKPDSPPNLLKRPHHPGGNLNPNPDSSASDIDYEMEIHFIPHSHQDIGWLETEKSYYEGYVSRMFESMLFRMAKDHTIKFNLADVTFLKFFLDESPEMSATVVDLIRKKQLELLSGAFAMVDHACPNYEELISTYQFGRKYVRDNLDGEVPKTDWMIDPFGLSKTVTKLSKLFGYEQQVVSRVSFPIKKKLEQQGDHLLNWPLGPGPGDKMKTLVLFAHYEAPPFMSFDDGFYWRADVGIVIDILHQSFFSGIYIQNVIDFTSQFSSFFKTRHIFFPSGGDFWYLNFSKEMDPLVAVHIFINSNNLSGRYAGKYRAHISLVSEYFKSAEQDLDKRNIHLADFDREDMMPLTEFDPQTPSRNCWVGYFVTSPHLKKSIRSFGQYYRGMRNILLAQAVLHPDLLSKLDLQRFVKETETTAWIMSANMHHDAITGTSMEYVDKHFYQRHEADHVRTYDLYSQILSSWFDGSFEKLALVSPRNETWKAEPGTHLVMNQAHGTNRVLRLFSNRNKRLLATDKDGKLLQSFSICEWNDLCETVVMMQTCPFCVHTLTISEQVNEPKSSEQPEPEQFDLGGVPHSMMHADGYMALVDTVTGSVVVNMSLNAYEFEQYIPENHPDYPNSRQESGLINPGKYIMTTSSKEPNLLKPDSFKYVVDTDSKSAYLSLSYFGGKISMQLVYNPWADPEEKLTVRFNIEPLTSFVKPDTELVVRYHTDVQNGDEFFSDSNGLFSIRRKARENGPAIEANYYPISNFAYIEDSNKRFVVSVDRPEAVASPQQGCLELLIHRRTSDQDWKGNPEPAFENKRVSILHHVHLEAVSGEEKRSYRELQMLLDSPPLVFKAQGQKDTQTVLKHQLIEYAESHTFSSYRLKGIKFSFDTVDGEQTILRIANLSSKKVAISLETFLQEAMAGRAKQHRMRKVGLDLVQADSSEAELLEADPMEISCYLLTPVD